MKPEYSKAANYAADRLRWWMQYRNDTTLSAADRMRARARIKLWLAELRKERMLDREYWVPSCR